MISGPPHHDAGAAPVLVLLHGAVLNGRMWDPVAAELAASFRIATPDLPGHGTRSAEPFRLDAAGAVVQATVEAVAPAPVVLCGDSLGSYVALAAAPTLGGQLAGALLGGCTADFQGPAALVHRTQVALTRLFPAAALQARLEQRVAREYAAGPAVLARGLRPAAFAEAVAELRRVDFRAALARFPAPLLLVNGQRDWVHRWGEGGAKAARPGVAIHRVRGVGHGVSLHRPAEFAALVRSFVAGLEPGEGGA